MFSALSKIWIAYTMSNIVSLMHFSPKCSIFEIIAKMYNFKVWNGDKEWKSMYVVCVWRFFVGVYFTLFLQGPRQRPANSKIFNPNTTRKKFLIPKTRPEPEKKMFLNQNRPEPEKNFFQYQKPTRTRKKNLRLNFIS